MKACIVFAQPGTDSFCHEILSRVKTALTKANVEVTVRDLYQMNFNPVLSGEEQHSNENNQPVTEIEEEQQLVVEADLLVMIYPVWWWSQPAILKGWIDRVFTNNFAFHYKANGPVGLFRDKQAIVFVTTRESASEMRKSGMDQVVEKQIVDGVLRFAGYRPVQFRHYAEVPYVSDQEREQMLKDAEASIADICSPVYT